MRKLHALGREDLELNSGSMLFARGHLDEIQFDALALVTAALRRAARALGPRPIGVEGL